MFFALGYLRILIIQDSCLNNSWEVVHPFNFLAPELVLGIILDKMKKNSFLLLILIEASNDCSDPNDNEDFLFCQVKTFFRGKTARLFYYTVS